jgi:hypothetical protein
MSVMALRAMVGLGLVVAGLLGGCGGAAGPSAHVLFIGNSYTSENDLPRLFADLSQAGGHPVAVEAVTVGGATLAQHLGGPDAPGRIAARHWEAVVLQEQSVLPALRGQRAAAMYPAARGLVKLARDAGARPVLLLTWGRRKGMPEAGFGSFAAMQDALTAGYLAIADELGATVAPAGEAWRGAVGRRPDLALWQADGSHPSLAGSYLTACVLYAALYGESPVGLAAPRGVLPEDAALLQQLARDTVLGDPARWHVQQ